MQLRPERRFTSKPAFTPARLSLTNRSPSSAKRMQKFGETRLAPSGLSRQSPWGSWEWAYRVGGTTSHASLRAGGPGTGFRDLDAERAILAGTSLVETGLQPFGLVDDRGRPREGPASLHGLDSMRFTTDHLPCLAGLAHRQWPRPSSSGGWGLRAPRAQMSGSARGLRAGPERPPT